MVTIEEEEAAADAIRQRAEERAAAALERADEALASPRPWRGDADHWGRDAHEAAGPQRRAAPAPAPAPAPSPPAAPAPDAGGPVVRMNLLEELLLKIVKTERAIARDRILEAVAPLIERIAGLEARLAHSEGRLAAVESKKGPRK